jgi:hypothetical protein
MTLWLITFETFQYFIQTSIDLKMTNHNNLLSNLTNTLLRENWPYFLYTNTFLLAYTNLFLIHRFIEDPEKHMMKR